MRHQYYLFLLFSISVFTHAQELDLIQYSDISSIPQIVLNPKIQTELQTFTSCLSCAHAVFDATSAEKIQKAVQRLQRQRDMQVQNSLLYEQMDSDILALKKMIQKIKTINIEV